MLKVKKNKNIYQSNKYINIFNIFNIFDNNEKICNDRINRVCHRQNNRLSFTPKRSFLYKTNIRVFFFIFYTKYTE